MTEPWKTGERVILSPRSLTELPRREIVTITRVTPSGRAVVGARQFFPVDHPRNSGREIGHSQAMWNRPRITRATPVELEEMQRVKERVRVVSETAEKIARFRAERYSIEQLRVICAALDASDG